MKSKSYVMILITLLLILSMSLSGCGVPGIVSGLAGQLDALDPVPEAIETQTPASTLSPGTVDTLEALQEGFSGVYTSVLPSVVNIQVVQKIEQGTLPDTGQFPLPFPFNLPGEGGEFRRSGLGSGFVWDGEGHIVTNNHVVEGADEISVTFYDGTSVDGEVVGTDRDSDLAVVKVDYAGELPPPMELADSTQVKVGQLVAAIGNPFGLQGTMTIGVISALGRSLPVGVSTFQGSTYTIPDVIQTDAPINPGNSGGVLVDMDARLVGVPTAIESSSGVNAGIGFVVPSVIVQKVVPSLIEKGFYEHPWIGISGRTMSSDIAERMGLSRDQHGVLVVDVTPDSPAEEAGLIGSDRLVTIEEQEVRLGGDLIIQIDSQPIQDFEDLTAYLARHTENGQSVNLTLLRDGQEEVVKLTLGVRPTITQNETMVATGRQGEVWLGINGQTISPDIAEAMGLQSGQSGVLIQQVFEGSPADQAGLRGSFKSITPDGEQVLIGGDVIIGFDDLPIKDLSDLQAALKGQMPGDEITLTILRDGDTHEVRITLETRP